MSTAEEAKTPNSAEQVKKYALLGSQGTQYPHSPNFSNHTHFLRQTKLPQPCLWTQSTWTLPTSPSITPLLLKKWWKSFRLRLSFESTKCLFPSRYSTKLMQLRNPLIPWPIYHLFFNQELAPCTLHPAPRKLHHRHEWFIGRMWKAAATRKISVPTLSLAPCTLHLVICTF